MKRILAALFVVLFANQASANVPQSLFNALAEDDKNFYLGGIAAGLVISNESNKANGYPPLFCFPDGISIGSSLAAAAMVGSDESMDVVIAVFDGFKKMFPCK